MSTTFPLPLECLQLIIRHLDDQFAHKSLVSLLCVNKHVCEATLPILFEDPCKVLPPKPSFGTPNENTLLNYRKLFQLLLRSLPPNCGLITDILHASFFLPEQDQERAKDQSDVKIGSQSRQETVHSMEENLQRSPSAFFPYFSFISRVTLESVVLQPRVQNFTLGILLHTPEFQDFLQSGGYTDRYQHEDPINYSYSINVASKEFYAGAAERDIRKDITWAFCYANAEHIQSLYLSIADIGRFKSLLPRFTTLSDITFQIDRNFRGLRFMTEEISEELSMALSKLEEERIGYLEDMVQFVEEHRHHHPKVLKTVRCANDRAYSDVCPEYYQMRLLQSFPPLIKPLYIDYRNWHHFITYFLDTDLSYVKKVDFIHETIEQSQEYIHLKQDLFLQRCHSLESISWKVTDENILKWAVQKHKDVTDGTKMIEVSSRPPLPLREYYVQLDQSSTGHHMRDILIEFNSVLERISIDFKQSDQHTTTIPNFEFGGNNNIEDDPLSSLQFPRLEMLHIHTSPHMSLQLHPSLLARSPNLKSIALTDIENIQPSTGFTFWEPAELHDLVDLSISGAATIFFHPDTLKCTHKLQTLTLHGETLEEELIVGDSDDGVSIPTIISKRPAWTWDWELPKLTYLHLAFDFALQFQFRMLEGTPNLNRLTLFISAESDRTIGIAELIKPGYHHARLNWFLERERQEKKRELEIDHIEENRDIDQSKDNYYDDMDEDEKIWEEFEYVHVPNLNDFILNGSWKVDYRLLCILFGKVAPHLKELNFWDCTGFSLTEWVKSTACHLHELERAYIHNQFTPQMAKDAGLEKMKVCLEFIQNYTLVKRPEGRLLDTPTIYSIY
ncbi:hypothetical protein FBU30_009675 [Linnemannia zychae]|nr:hypothetical protein FBU30_009675 [Linnemannia zychae]